jgi:hypothetical protein
MNIMKKGFILFLCLFLAACAKVETAPTADSRADANKNASVAPTPAPQIALKPVAPNVKLNKKQQKFLDESLPPAVREILEKAETFEILAEVKTQERGDGLNFEPNRVAKIASEADKKEILEAFYFDASTAEPPAACYIPHHAIRARYGGKTVEVEICFECARFYVTGDAGKFEGTIVRDDRKSEDVFTRIVENNSVELKP